jgi:type VI secretion system secreted protein VgrG
MIRPDMVLASAAGIAMTATDSTHMASVNDHAVTAGRDSSLSVGRSYYASVRGSISLFAYLDGMKFHAARGAVEIQAQSGPVSLAALKDFTISSTDGKIVITAAKEVWIGAGGSYIQINGSGIINGSPGPILEKGASWDVLGASSVRKPPLALPCLSIYDEQIQAIDEVTGQPIPDLFDLIRTQSGGVYSGHTNAEGLCERIATNEPEELSVWFGQDAEDQMRS